MGVGSYPDPTNILKWIYPRSKKSGPDFSRVQIRNSNNEARHTERQTDIPGQFMIPTWK